MFWKRKNKPILEEVKLGTQLQHAEEMTVEESFVTLINRKARYPVKMYTGRHAEILFRTEDKIYWGFPKAGFSTTYVKRLYYCEASRLDTLIKRFGDFTLFKGEQLVAKWFTENVPEPNAERGGVKQERSRIDIIHSDSGCLLIFEGTYSFFNEEMEELEKKDRTCGYRKIILVAEYRFKAYFSNGEKIERIEIAKQ